MLNVFVVGVGCVDRPENTAVSWEPSSNKEFELKEMFRQIHARFVEIYCFAVNHVLFFKFWEIFLNKIVHLLYFLWRLPKYSLKNP